MASRTRIVVACGAAVLVAAVIAATIASAMSEPPEMIPVGVVPKSWQPGDKFQFHLMRRFSSSPPCSVSGETELPAGARPGQEVRVDLKRYPDAHACVQQLHYDVRRLILRVLFLVLASMMVLTILSVCSCLGLHEDADDDQPFVITESHLAAATRLQLFWRARAARTAASELQRSRLAAVDALPDNFRCPITLELMEDPTILAQSGISYERAALEAALARRPGVCPASGRTFAGPPSLTPNHALRGLIQDARAAVASAPRRRKKKKKQKRRPAEENRTAKASAVPSRGGLETAWSSLRLAFRLVWNHVDLLFLLALCLLHASKQDVDKRFSEWVSAVAGEGWIFWFARMFLGPHIIFDYATAIVIFQVLMFPKLTVFERWAKFRWSHLYVYTLLSWRWIYTLLTCPWYGRAALRGLRDTHLSNVVYLSRYTNQPGSKAIVESEKFSTLLASRISTALVLSLVMVEAVYIILCTAQLVAAPVLLLLVVFPFAFRDQAAHGEVVDAELADFRGNPDEYKALWLEK